MVYIEKWEPPEYFEFITRRIAIANSRYGHAHKAFL